MVTYMKMYGYKINDNVSNACLKNLKSIDFDDYQGIPMKRSRRVFVYARQAECSMTKISAKYIRF